VAQTAQYPRIPEQRDDLDVRPGPRRLPMALPHYRVITPKTAASGASLRVVFPAWPKVRDSLTRLNVPHDVQLERCWLYLLQGKANGSDQRDTVFVGEIGHVGCAKNHGLNVCLLHTFLAMRYPTGIWVPT
jgi:hypothetical protein